MKKNYITPSIFCYKLDASNHFMTGSYNTSLGSAEEVDYVEADSRNHKIEVWDSW